MLTRHSPFFLFLLSFLTTIDTRSQYHTFESMTAELKALSARHPSLASLSSIGTTGKGREIWLLTVGGKAADTRRAILIVGGADGSLIAGSEAALRFAGTLLDRSARTDSVAQIIKSTTFYIMPRVSPDATDEFFRLPLAEHPTNMRPIDDDKDGEVDEDGAEDLNRDGVITMMRVNDGKGEWMIHPEEARIMKKAERTKGESGIWSMYTEGLDNDGDEKWNEDGSGGVEFNRNFPQGYSFFSPGSGPHQVSESETRAVADFAIAHPNIAAVLTFSNDENLMTPWKPEKGSGGESGERRQRSLVTSVLADDEEYYSFVSKQFRDMTHLNGAPAAGESEGSFVRWAYYQYGRWSFGALPWWIPSVEARKDTAVKDSSANKDSVKPGGRKDAKGGKEDETSPEMNALKWIDDTGFNGFVPWSKFAHKDFPGKDVEIGGFRPYFLSNPPAESLDAIANRYTDFLLWLAGKLPDIAIREPKVEPRGSGVFRVTLDVVNEGYFPTNSAMGKRTRLPRDVKVSLNLNDGQSLAGGRSVILLDPLAGSGGRQEVSWIIVAPRGGSVSVSAESPIAGSVIHHITLK